MKTTRKNVVAAAGLSAVLALTPVAGPVATAFAQDNGDAAVQAKASDIWVNLSLGNLATSLQADNTGRIGTSSIAANLEGVEYLTWTDAQGVEHRIEANQLSTYIFTESCTVTAHYGEQAEGVVDVTFKVINPADGTEVSSNTVKTDANGKLAAAPEDPVIEGYEFTGYWVDELGNLYKPGTLTTIEWTASKTFTAQFKSTEGKDGIWNMTFKVVSPIDNTPVSSTTLQTNEDGYVAAPEAPEFEGWEFDGWQDMSDKEHGYPVYPASHFNYSGWTSDHVFVAHYVKQAEEPAQVTFQVPNPADPEVIWSSVIDNADENGKVDAPADPQFEGWKFLGWEDKATGKLYSADQIAAATWTTDTVLTAKFVEQAAESVEVTFKVKSPVDGSEYATISTADENGKVAAPADPQVIGYDFTGWADEAGTVYSSAEVAERAWTESTVLTAQFEKQAEEAAQVTFQVTSPVDGSTYAVIATADENGKVAQPADPVVEGYDFVAWVDAAGNEYTSAAVAELTWKQDTVLTAKFLKQAEEAVELTFQVTSPVDGSIYSVIATADENGKVPAPADPVVEGWNFVGWADEAGNIYTSEAVATLEWDKSTVFTAQFVEQAVETVDVTFKVVSPADGSEYAIIATADENGKVAQPADPVVDGYNFIAWVDEQGNEYTSSAVATLTWTKDTVLTAKFLEQAVETVDVTFDVTSPVDGSHYAVIATADENGNIPQPADPKFEGWNFIGWADAAGNVYSSAVVASMTWTEDTVLTAQFEQVTPAEKTFTVTFDDCLANTENLVVEVKEGDTVAKPADPVCEGWTFLGWYSDTALTQAYDFAAPVTSDMVLYAKWQKNEPATGEEGTETEVTPTTPEENAANEDKMPQTSDNTMAVAGGVAAVAGVSFVAAMIAALKRRFQ